MEKTAGNRMLKLNKYFYAGFGIAGAIFIFLKDYRSAIIFMGISLAFDPFNQSVPFQKRPVWQRVWQIAHLIITLTLLYFSLK
jgi:hypothetical protein